MRKAATAGHATQPGMCLERAYTHPAAPRAIQPTSVTRRKAFQCEPAGPACACLAIGLILASGIWTAPAMADEPPPNLAKLVAQRESEAEAERNEYTYRQTVILEELDDKGAARGQYKEVRDVIFSPKHERTEEV